MRLTTAKPYLISRTGWRPRSRWDGGPGDVFVCKAQEITGKLFKKRSSHVISDHVTELDSIFEQSSFLFDLDT